MLCCRFMPRRNNRSKQSNLNLSTASVVDAAFRSFAAGPVILAACRRVFQARAHPVLL